MIVPSDAEKGKEGPTIVKVEFLGNSLLKEKIRVVFLPFDGHFTTPVPAVV